MSAKRLQSFASGLLVASITIGTVYYMSDSTEKHAHLEHEIENTVTTTEEMIHHLEDKGYAIVSADEWEAWQDEQNEKIDNVHQDEDPVYRMILHITKGMSSIDIAKQLHRGQIIDDEEKFLQLVTDLNVAQSFQIGEYELASDQSYEEIVSLLTK